MKTTIPAQIVNVVRSAVLTELGEAAAQIEEAKHRLRKGEASRELRGALSDLTKHEHSWMRLGGVTASVSSTLTYTAKRSRERWRVG